MSETVEWGNVCSRVDTCALTGAAAFFTGIKDAEVLVNGPLWCYFYALRHLEKANCRLGERFHGSQPDNNAVVYGTEECLTEALEYIRNNRKPSILLIENSCSVSLIGDDIEGIAAKSRLPFPVVGLDSGGLNGGFAEGYSKASLRLWQYLDLPDIKIKCRSGVNLLGCTTAYFNGKNDLDEIKRILEIANYRVIATPGAGGELEVLQKVPAAQLNIVINEELGLETAKYLKERYGTPYVVVGIPYGLKGTMRWLEKITEALPADLENIREECEKTRIELLTAVNEARCTWGELWFDKIIVAAPGTTAICMAQALREEWADTEKLIVICQNRVKKLPAPAEADEILLAEKDSKKIEQLQQQADNTLILGSSSESSVLLRERKRFWCCNIAYPVQDEVLLAVAPFAGIRGAGHMLQRLWNLKIKAQLPY